MAVDTAQFNGAVKKVEAQFGILNQIRDQLSNTVNELKGSIDMDPAPMKFVGVVQGYRFTTGTRGQTPTHRFEVDCGNGLYLHVEATPADFAAMLSEMDMGDITPSKINGKLVIVRRDRFNGLIPQQMLDVEVFPGVRDRFGSFLYDQATVFVISVGTRGTVTACAGSDIRVLFEDSEQAYYSNDNIVLAI